MSAGFCDCGCNKPCLGSEAHLCGYCREHRGMPRTLVWFDEVVDMTPDEWARARDLLDRSE